MKDIEVVSLFKSFGNHAVFQNFSANFPAGSITCIMGPSGCGKTTLLRLLLGLEEPDSGKIMGANVPKAAVFQENRLFEDFSPVSNVAAVLPGRSNPDLISITLSALGLGGNLNAPVRNLSGGMKRRVALVRAMLAPASLVVLDEPFTGLDEEAKQRAMLFVKEHAQRKTILLVTHDPIERDFFEGSYLVLVPASER